MGEEKGKGRKGQETRRGLAEAWTRAEMRGDVSASMLSLL